MVLPKEILEDDQQGVHLNGYYGRKGSLAAMLANMKRFAEISNGTLSDTAKAELEVLTRDQMELIPVLKGLEFMSFFPLEEWLHSNHPGRVFVALLYTRRYPDETPHLAAGYIRRSAALEYVLRLLQV